MQSGDLYKKFVLIVLFSALVSLISAETIARVGFGLGTPPLSIPHSRIEYMFAPNQRVYRFHNLHAYNSYSMRNEQDPFGQNPILVLGDSVLNGGNLTDQSKLATTLLANYLSRERGESAFVGNVSAGSWGPANMLAWVKEYGLFDATQLILVLSSHDLNDKPNFSDLRCDTQPTKRPLSATIEGIQRYASRYLPKLIGSRITCSNDTPTPRDPYYDVPSTLDALSSLIDISREVGAEICVILHFERDELEQVDSDNHLILRRFFDKKIIPVISMSPFLIRDLSRGHKPYREFDNIHLSEYGHVSLFLALKECI